MGAHMFVHPEGEVIAAAGAEKAGALLMNHQGHPTAFWRILQKPVKDLNGSSCILTRMLV